MEKQILRFATLTSQQRACRGPWLAQDDTCEGGFVFNNGVKL
jgi:hypothetical protein